MFFLLYSEYFQPLVKLWVRREIEMNFDVYSDRSSALSFKSWKMVTLALKNEILTIDVMAILAFQDTV